MPNSPQITPIRRIEVLAFPRVQLLDVAGPLQVFASAGAYEVAVVAPSSPVRTSSGLELLAQPLPAADAPLDTLVVAGGWGVDEAIGDESLVAWVAARARVARRVASVCSGAYLLAQAGLLEGRRATTHWGRCGDFARRFPRVRLEPDPIFVQDGNVWTSAGITAGIDLALALVEADLGRRHALAVARQLVVFLKRPGGQAQFSAALELQQDDGRFDRLHGWIAGNLAGDLSVTALAAAAGMSERSFLRHYRQATGTTPARAVERLRVEAARNLLEQGHPVKRVAARCGFGSEESLRRGFLRLMGITPGDYRDRFTTTGQGRPSPPG
ncbi:MAG TPA: helix-turn-helix domain-containing protein [Magnetospirillum sp.]|jgi:transcriptional regulator GlxA family with amidase domain|nr:helix-turn-helix domain-containing protein [Magnetospirillum sp.]